MPLEWWSVEEEREQPAASTKQPLDWQRRDHGDLCQSGVLPSLLERDLGENLLGFFYRNSCPICRDRRFNLITDSNPCIDLGAFNKA